MLGEYVPIFVDSSIDDDAALLGQVVAYRRSLPPETSSFGALRWLSQDEQIRGPMQRLPRGEVMLNYMGQITQHSDASGLPRTAPEPLAPSIDPTNRRPDLFWCQGGIIDASLSINVLYSVNMYRRSTVEAIVGRFQAALQSLALRCQEYAALQDT
jgi:non-ribosomal peptide synthase protein (TIGR01720 family)